MAKTIKFNLICDNKPIRTIEDLQNNFSIEDVLEYYDNRLLHRWLEVRGYEEELEKVRAITTDSPDDPIEVAKQLIKIFNVISDDKKIEESVYILEYLKERQELYSIYEKDNYKIRNIIEDYEKGYNQLVDNILQHPNDVAIIKAAITEMVSNYSWVLKLNYRDLFYELTEESSLAIMCFLMNGHSRNYFLPIETKNEDGTITYDTEIDADKDEMFDQICLMITSDMFRKELGENLVSFAGTTEGYWKDLEPKGKKYMIISMGSGDFVRSSGLSGGDLSSADIKNKFVIIDGIDYKSNYSTHQLLYMEV